jgi:hypothetical protein
MHNRRESDVRGTRSTWAYGRERLQLTGTMVHLLGLDLELTGQGAVRTAVELAAGINPADIGQAGICCRDLVFDWCATGQPALLADFVDHDTVDFDFRAKTGPWTYTYSCRRFSRRC